MTKVLFLLSVIIMGVAGFFAWQNQKSLKDTRLSVQDLHRKVKTELQELTRAADGVVVIKNNITEMNNQLEKEKISLGQEKDNVKIVANKVINTAEQVKETNGKIEKIKLQVPDLPPGVTIENVGEKINSLKTSIAENEEKGKKAEESAVLKKKDLDKVHSELASIQRQIQERHKLFDRNSLSATVIAVNNDWGFVVIDAGKNKEITSDTKLLVTRGTETIGKLTIQSVEANRTIASIIQKSLRSGLTVAPGDKVILETLYQ